MKMVNNPDIMNRLNPDERVSRKDSDFRPQFYKLGVVSGASGSSYIEFGETKIMTAVNGPNELTKSGDLLSADPNKGKILVRVKFSEFGKRTEGRRRDIPSKEESRLSDMLTDALKPVIILTKFPKAVLEINVTVVEDRGSIVSAMSIGAGLALVDASIELHDVIVATDIRISGPRSLVDPTSQETYSPMTSKSEAENIDEGSLSYALMPSIRQVCLLQLQGEVSVSRIQTATREAEESCLSLLPQLKEVIRKGLENKN